MTRYDFHGTTSNSPEHYTPTEWIERVKGVMGDIDIDPASSDVAQEVVQAKNYYTVESDGLSQEWHGRVFINPPGDKTGKIVRLFWSKLVLELVRNHVSEFIWLAFNISQLRTLQHPEKPFMFDGNKTREVLENSSVCVPSSRIHFTARHPTRDSAFIYTGPNKDKFKELFGPHGIVL